MTASDSHEQLKQPDLSGEVLPWIKEVFLKIDRENGILKRALSNIIL
jgi:hypothetical protein